MASITVGSAEFEMLMNLPAFKKQVEQDAPASAKVGAQKVATELEAGAKKASEIQIAESKRTVAQIIADSKRRTDAVLSGFDRENQAAQRAATATRAPTSQQSQVFGNSAQLIAYTAAVALAGKAFSDYTKTVSETVKLQDELNKEFGAGTVQLQSYTAQQNAFDKLGKAASDFGTVLAHSVAPALTPVVNALAKAVSLAEKLIALTLPKDEQRQVEEAKKLRDANDDAAKAQRQAVADSAKASADAADQEAKAHIDSIEKQKAAAADNLRAQKAAVEQARDAKLKAVHDEEKAALEGLDAEEKAQKRAVQAAIVAAEVQRDAQIKAVEDSRDKALEALDREAKARDEIRKQEDRALEDSTERERRALDTKHAASLRALDSEADAIRRKSDAALKAIDDEISAEDRRHSEAIDNIDRERDARIGAVDEQLRALSNQQRAESRQETAQSLQQALGQARGDLSQARTPADIRRARAAVQRAEQDIAREKRRNDQEDLKLSLEDQKVNINREIDVRKKAENDKTTAVKQGLSDQQQAIQADATNQLAAVEGKKKKQADDNAAELLAYQQHLKDFERAREDARALEDAVAEERKIKVAKDAKAEVDAIKAAYDDPQNGIIASLHKQEQDLSDSFDKRRTRIQQHTIDQENQINAVANFQNATYANQEASLINFLNGQLRHWQEYATNAKQIASTAAGQVNQPQAPAAQQQQSYAQQQGFTTNYGQPVRNVTPSLPIQLHAQGTMIREPTLMYGTRTGQWGLAGEAGDEYLGPLSKLGGNINFAPTINVDGRGVANIEQLGDMVVKKAMTEFVSLLDGAQQSAGTRAKRTLPGAA